MSAPIALFAGQPLEPATAPGMLVVGEDAIGVPFDVTLGAVLAMVIPLPVPVPAAAKPPDEPASEVSEVSEVLELGVDGDWPVTPAAGPATIKDLTGPDSPDQPEAPESDLVLEKNLDTWLAAFGRRERASRPVEVGSDPNEVRLDEPAPDGPAPAPDGPAPVPDRVAIAMPSICLTGLWSGPPVPVVVTPARQSGLLEAPEAHQSETQRSVRTDDSPQRRPRVSQVPGLDVEIGGFGFPDLLPESPVVLDPLLGNNPLAPDGQALPGEGPVPAAPRVPGRALGAEPSSRLANEPTPVGPSIAPMLAVAAPLQEVRLHVGAEPSSRLANEPTPVGPSVAPMLAVAAPLHEVRLHGGSDGRTVQAESSSPRQRLPNPEIADPPSSLVVAPASHQSEPDHRDAETPTRRSREPRILGDKAPAGARPDSETAGLEIRIDRQPIQEPPSPVRVGLPRAPQPLTVTGPTPFDRFARRIDHLTLELKDDAGDYGRLRVSVSGPLVRATIMPTDPAMADRLSLEIRQLKTNLEARGFPEPKVTIQAPAAAEPILAAPVVRELGTAQPPPGQSNPQRPGEDDRRGRWAAGRDQRRDDQRPQDQNRKSPQNQGGDPQ